MYRASLGARAKQTATKITNTTLAIMLVISSVAVAAPLLFSGSAAALTNYVVTPTQTHGWTGVDDNAPGGSSAYVAGPNGANATGYGSVQMSVNTPAQGYLFAKAAYGHTKLSELTNLSYDTYVQQGNDTIAPSIQLNIAKNVDDPSITWQGRLVYEPYVNGTVTDGQWQHWDAANGKWWLSKSATNFDNNCGQASPCTLAQLIALYPSIGINNSYLAGVGFKAGSGWNVPFVGNVDNFTILDDNYDFEPTLPSTPTNLQPVDGAYTNNSSFSMTWDTVSNAVDYEYRTSNSSNGSTLGPIVWSDSSSTSPGVYNIGASTVTRSNNGAPDAPYYWQVRAVTSDGLYSDWSAISKVTVDTAAPANIAITPTAGTSLTGSQTWTATATDTNASSIYLVLNQGATKITDNTVDGTTGTTSSTLTYDTNLLANGTYTIVVKASDKAGNMTTQSFDYTVNHNLPEAPTGIHAKFQNDLLDLANGSTINYLSKDGGTNNLELLWDTPSDWVTSYHILATFPDGTTSLGYQGPNTNSWLNLNGFGEHGQGAYSYRVVAVNPNGESQPSETYTVTYDTTPPTATLTQAPANNGYVTDDFEVAATAEDNLGLSDVFFDVRSADGSTWATGCVNAPILSYDADHKNANIACTIDTSGLTEGVQYMLRVHASDNAGYGNTNSDSQVLFTVDRSHPVLNITSPTMLTIQKGTMTVSGTATDTISGVEGQTVSLHLRSVLPNGDLGADLNTFTATVASDGSWTTNLDTTDFADGIYGITGFVSDIAGNDQTSVDGTSVKPLTIDNGAPSAPLLTSPVDGSFSDTRDVKLRWSSVSDLTGINHYEILYSSSADHTSNANNEELNGTGTQSIVSTTNTHKIIHLPTDGTWFWQVRAIDNANNVGNWSSIWSVTADTLDPTALITYPANATIVGGTSLTIDGTASDENFKSYTYSVKDSLGNVVNGTPQTSTTSVTAGELGTWDITGLPSGTYSVRLTVRDKAGRTTTVNRQFQIDHTKPAVTIKAPSNDSYVDSSFKVKVSASDDDSGIDHVTVTIKDSDGNVVVDQASTVYHPQTQRYTYNASNLPDGDYVITARAYDVVGNTKKSAQVAVTVDTTAPATPVASPAGGNYTTTQIVTLTSSDLLSGLRNIYFTLDGSTPSLGNGTLYSTPFSVTTSQTVKAIAYDNAGNVSTVLTAVYTITPVVVPPTTTPVVTAPTIVSVASIPTTAGSSSSSNSDSNNSATPQVLGESTGTPRAAKRLAILADRTPNKKVYAATSSSFMGLGWWWLPVLAALAAAVGAYVLVVRRVDNK